ncbi:MAG TPA: hypothetical protein VNF73_06390 [Candidatus Saccharimonadales bacterium]|nr:hypothetical protein [Candidatus Saccharimonadales bacterium]
MAEKRRATAERRVAISFREPLGGYRVAAELRRRFHDRVAEIGLWHDGAAVIIEMPERWVEAPGDELIERFGGVISAVAPRAKGDQSSQHHMGLAQSK